MRPINFTSIHDYLDMLFDGITPSEDTIINAKKEYWRAYNTDLKRRKRKAFPIFQISFSKQNVTVLKSKLEKGQSISKYIHGLVVAHLYNHTDLVPRVNTALIEQQLFLISEYLRELLDYEHIDTDKIEQLESHIGTLETVIQESL
ncbi:hypothetical protein [uncultured Lacinutrix sp.]|uniref:hypothetical protein n=1 Tax=uncultured Lacinutrix sp. TaxID=574032 RepID=UPI002624607F|nr:hypothetical protein [uncultured Lacinutrix sp.]